MLVEVFHNGRTSGWRVLARGRIAHFVWLGEVLCRPDRYHVSHGLADVKDGSRHPACADCLRKSAEVPL